MAKRYTIKEKEDKNTALNDGFNREASGVLAEFNGQLSQEMLPYETLTSAYFTTPSVVTGIYTKPDGSQTNGVGWIGQTQSYFTTFRNEGDFTWERDQQITGGIFGPPEVGLSSDSGTWQTSFVPLSIYYDSGTFLRIPTQEGVLKGCAQLDLEYYGYDRVVDGIGTGNWGTDGRYVMAVFVNDIMVAATGLQGAGKRLTYSLPFATPIGSSDNVDIDIRLYATFELGYTGAGASFPHPAVINLYNAQLWVRNQYR